MALHHYSPGEVASLSTPPGGLESLHTHALAKTDRFEAIRLIVPAAGAIASHAVPGLVTLHCLTGKVHLQRTDGTVVMKEGDWVHLSPGEQHSLQGCERASLLMMIIF